MKRTLIISPFLPYPFYSGGHQAIYNGIACLQDVTEVFFIYPTTESRAKKKEYEVFERKLPFVKCVPYILPESKHDVKWFVKCCKNKARAFFGKTNSDKAPAAVPPVNRTPNIEIPVLSEHFCQFVLSVIKKNKIDIVQVEMIDCIRMIDWLPSSVKTIFVHHELRWVRNELLLKQVEGSPGLNEVYLKAKNEEIGYLNRYDQIIVLSRTDQEKLQSVGVTAPIIPSFAVVEGEYRLPSSMFSPRLLSFIGPSFHYPNYDGVLWFLENCWPELLSRCPDYRLQIIGKWDQETMMSIQSRFKQVAFLGYVDDLESAIKDSILIVPLNIGSGIRMKILEAARLGVPVVSTSIGAEGLPVRDNESILVADTPESFVNAIWRLQDSGLRDKLVASLQQIVKMQYSIDALRESRRSVYL